MTDKEKAKAVLEAMRGARWRVYWWNPHGHRYELCYDIGGSYEFSLREAKDVRQRLIDDVQSYNVKNGTSHSRRYRIRKVRPRKSEGCLRGDDR